jgi:geranylgeranyl pyrophosphate synthase
MNLQEFSKEFDKYLFRFIKQKIKKYKKLAKDKDIENFICHIEKYLKNGKRLRPYGVYLTFSESKKALKERDWMVMLCVELIHALALIHDDIIDRAVSRRGVASINGFIQNQASFARGDKNHYANSQAILIGDLLYAAAFEILFEAKTQQKVHNSIVELLDEVIVGQMIDVKLAYTERASKHLILRKTKYKTAFYTFARPFEIGSILGGLSTQKQKEFFNIGEKMGILYQLQDDYLDVFGDEKILKKEGMNDIREGQQTLLTDYFFSHANEEQKILFNNFLGKNFLPKHSVTIRNLLQEVGTGEYILKEIKVSTKKIETLISKSTANAKTKASLLSLIAMLGARI